MNTLQHASMLPATLPVVLDAIRALEQHDADLPQTPVVTRHVIHGGQYHRTICLPAGSRLVGVLIKVPTTVVLAGHARVLLGDGQAAELAGFHVLRASPGRKQVFYALADTHLTMTFATSAKTVEEAEAEFTDECGSLASRNWGNHVVITGE